MEKQNLNQLIDPKPTFKSSREVKDYLKSLGYEETVLVRKRLSWDGLLQYKVTPKHGSEIPVRWEVLDSYPYSGFFPYPDGRSRKSAHKSDTLNHLVSLLRGTNTLVFASL